MNSTQKKEHLRLPIPTSLLLTVSLMFFMSFFAFPEVTLYRYMVVLVFALLLFIAVRSRLVMLLAAPPCLLAFLGAEGSPILPLLLCTIAVIGFGGFAAQAIHPLILAATPVLAYLLALGITQDPSRSLSVLLLIPATLVLALALRHKLSKTASIAAVAVALSATVLALVLFALLSAGTVPDVAFVSDLITSFREQFVSEFMSAANSAELSSVLGNVTRESVSTLVNAFLRLLPAILIVIVEILSYFACLIAVTLRNTQFPEHPLPHTCLAFRMSAVSAVLFLISFVLSLLPAGNSDTVGVLLVSAMNLFVILLPGLALCGVLRLLVSFRQKRFLSPILLFLLFLWFSSLIPTILALIGAIAILRTEKAVSQNGETKK